MKKKTNLHIVLFEPEIAGNVGTIMRTCVAVNAKLHIIEPLGFFFDKRFLKRASANHLEDLVFEKYDDWKDFYEKNNNPDIYFLTRYGKEVYSNVNFSEKKDIFLMFGKESTGIPLEILQKNKEKCFRIPMSKTMRSINIACAVNIVAYEVMRQLSFDGLEKKEYQKGADYLDN